MLSVTCAPMACGRSNGALSVMPVPETCALAACTRVSGAVREIVGAPNLGAEGILRGCVSIAAASGHGDA